MSFPLAVVGATVEMLLQASPYILFGLLAAGLIHVLLPESLIVRWLGQPGLSGVVRAAIIGVPLPVCSCGVVPITVALRRKGASPPAAQSFLITTPESSIDSIFLTWGMMGPLMAIARPVAAFFTAVLGGVLSIASARRGELETVRDTAARACPEGGCAEPTADAPAVTSAASDRARLALRTVFLRRERSGDPPRLGKDLVRPALRYGFGELLDDLAFWLVAGLVIAGALAALLPDDLGALGLGAGILPMILLLAVSIPMYMCASASTPIAAALLAKGVSPGAALVFLLAGPATNAATVLLLIGTFGRRFVKVYLVSVVAGALGAGLLLDALVGAGNGSLSGITIPGESAPGLWSVLATLVLSVLLVRSLWRGAWKSGLTELGRAWQRVRDLVPSSRG